MRLSQLMLLAIAAYLCSGLALWAQASDSQTDEANKSWTATTESQSDNVNPTRTIESHTQSDNRTLDKQSVQRRGSDGHFEPYQDIEKETVQVDAATVRTTTRTFGRDADGVKTLVEVIEEEKHILPGGDSKVVRATSDPDANGNLQLVQSRIEETKRTSKDVEETKITVMLPTINGGLVPAVRVQERLELDANGTVESQQTTLLPDGAGTWQVEKIQRTTTRQEGDNRRTEEQVSLPDSEGKLGEVSRTVSNEAATPSLKWSDVDFSSLELNVVRSIYLRMIGNCKTEDSRKPVPLDAHVAADLWVWKEASKYSKSGDWIFASPHTQGKYPFWPDILLLKIIQPAARRAGIKKRIGWHTFRHSYSSLLVANGENVKVVQELMRHVSSRFTLDVYSQARKAAKRQAQQRVVQMILPKNFDDPVPEILLEGARNYAE
jgi:hypothetical protein